MELGSSSDDNLVLTYAPYIYFAKGENCYPISINEYLLWCRLKSRIDPTISIQATIPLLWDKFATNEKDTYLSFAYPGWEEGLMGSPKDASCYARIIRRHDGSVLLLYFYLFSHVSAYKCCGCLCDLDKYAHLADIKFIAVELKHDVVSRVYYGAHGEGAGVWKDESEIESINGHPVAYATRGDHSFYYDECVHPRIFGIVYDVTEKYSLSLPTPSLVYAFNDERFNPDTMGWVYFPGKMNEDGIDPPANQGWWRSIPEQSNSWFKRLFCPGYF